MEGILAETARSIEIMQKRKEKDDVLYIAKDDSNPVPILVEPKIREFRNELNQMDLTDVDIQNRVFNDQRCTNIESAANLYLNYQYASPSS